MRAVLLENPEILNNEIKVIDDQFHHLKNVCRVKLDQRVLLLDGAGVKYQCSVKDIRKKEITLIVNEEEYFPKKEKSAFICLVKKDALELIIRQSVELGVTDLHILASARSQNYKLNQSRVEQIIKSAMIQSNSPYTLNLHFQEFEPFVQRHADKIVCFSTEVSTTTVFGENHAKRLPLIGPEGGFTSNEIDLLKRLNVPFVTLDQPIMRAETAFLFAQGLFSKANY